MRSLALLMALAVLAPAQLKLVQRIPMPGVEGRIDHLAADVHGKRLFVAALGNNTLEVLDVDAGKVARTMKGFDEPQGIAYVPALNRIFVANGGNGNLRIIDGASFHTAGEVDFGGDADNVRYDSGAGRIWVGYGSGALGAVDAATGRRTGDIPLGAHPESFQLSSGGARIWVNVPQAGHIALVDAASRKVLATLPVTAAAANFPMALDEAGGRLFVGCRKPAKVLVYDTAARKLVSQFDCVGDTDDLFYDPSRKRIYVVGGAGAIAVIRQAGPDRYEPLGTIHTAAGARTALFVPDWGRLYLAVPHRGNQRAEIRVYQPE